MKYEIRKAIVNHTSEMLDNPNEHGIYPTSEFFDNLEKEICEIFMKEVEE